MIFIGVFVFILGRPFFISCFGAIILFTTFDSPFSSANSTPDRSLSSSPKKARFLIINYKKPKNKLKG